MNERIDSGYIELYRAITDHWIWTNDEPFDKRSAWVDLLLMANHKDNNVFMNGSVIEVKRGQRITSTTLLAERWKWSRGKVRKYLSLLESQNMIKTTAEPRQYTLITIVNYSNWQGSRSAQKPTKSPEGAHEEPTASLRRAINNHDNHDKHVSTMKDIMSSKHDGMVEEISISDPTSVEKTDTSDAISSRHTGDDVPYEVIVDTLNGATGKSFRWQSKATKSKIKARWDEGYRLVDFQNVISKKVAQWKGDPKFDQYLRPETLFGTKFDSYLNEHVIRKSKKTAGRYVQQDERELESDPGEWIAQKIAASRKADLRGD